LIGAESQTAPPNRRIALVIGAGSVKCAAALGLQKVLDREGIGVDLVVGCSGGSMYATFIALGINVQTAEEMTRRLWTSELTKRRHYPSLLRAMLPQIFPFRESFGLVDDRLILDRLQTAFGKRTFEEARIPLYLTATDFHTGEQVVFSSGKLVDAIRASIAIPYVFRPWPIDGRLFVDGFLTDPMPVGVAIKHGANVIVTLGFESPYQKRTTSILRFAFQLSSIMSNNLLRANYAFHNLAHHTEILPIIPQFRESIRLFDTHKIPYVIEEGERAAEQQLPYLRRLLEAQP
jgi:NTE family protein